MKTAPEQKPCTVSGKAPRITITGLCKSFGTKSVLRDFNLTVSSPLVLMGPSGCGKTTLLRIMLGLETADAGQVAGLGAPAAVFQEDRLCPQLTAVGNICLTGRGVPEEHAQKELRALGFTEKDLVLPVANLSGGQKRRVALLRALLCQNADTLLLDEPFTGMDAELVTAAAAATARLTAGRPAILVTHDAAAVAALGWQTVRLST